MASCAACGVGSSGKGDAGESLTGTSVVSTPAPAHAGRGVFQQHALGGQLVTDGVGAGEVARLLGAGALVDQRLDAGIVVAPGAAAGEPPGRILLQQSQRE